jgi:hypothetical protein
MNYYHQRRAALLTAIISLCILLTSIVLPLSASALAAADARQHHPHLHKPLAFEAEDGKVTDNDGIIGNSLHGADAGARAHDAGNKLRDGIQRAADGAADAAGDVANGVKGAADDIMDGIRGAADRAGDAMRGAEDGVRSQGESDGGNVTDQSNRGTTQHDDRLNQNDGAMTQDGDNGSNVIGWVIAVLIILAIALVVLALLPKKQRDRH